MGGFALLNVAFAIGGAKLHVYLRVPAQVLVALMGVGCIGLALSAYFKKKPERPKYVPKKRSKDQS